MKSHKVPETDARSPADGRRARSESSRSKIVAAMLELVRSGDHSPQAARVAELAGVAVRSVFRHFADMDTLYREMAETIERQVLPIVQQAPTGETWKHKLRDIAHRRFTVFEAIMPYRNSASLRRFQSAYLLDDYNRLHTLEVALIKAQLPPTLAKDSISQHALFLILGFHSWRALRQDHALPVDEAKAVILQLLEHAMAALPDR